MKTILTLINKDTRAPRTLSGLHAAALTEPCVVQLSVDSVHDIALLERQGHALVMLMRAGDRFTVDGFCRSHHGVKNTLVLEDAYGERCAPDFGGDWLRDGVALTVAIDMCAARGGERQVPGPRHGARASAVPAVA